MIYSQIQNSEIVAYPSQTYDAAISCPESDSQLRIEKVVAFNGSAAPNNIAIAHSMNSGNLSLGASGNNYVFSAKEKFNLIALSVGTADSSGVTFSYEYWNGAWASITPVNSPVLTSTGKKAILFNAPIDWTLDGSSYYSIRLAASGAPNYVFSGVRVCAVLSYKENIDANGSVEVDFSQHPLLLQQGEALVPFFLYSDSSNTIKASYHISP